MPETQTITTIVPNLSVKRMFFWHTGVGQQKVFRINDNNNTHKLSDIASAVNEIDVYYSFLTSSLPRKSQQTLLNTLFQLAMCSKV